MDEAAPIPGPQHKPQRVSPWKVAVGVMVAGLLGFFALVLWRAAFPASWEFSIEAATQVVEINLRPGSETRWQIDGATLCSRGKLEALESYRVKETPTPCGSRAWRAYRITEPEQVVVLRGGGAIFMERGMAGALAMSLRSEDAAGLGRLAISGMENELAMGDAVNVIWPGPDGVERTFPFSGATTIGRAVSWSDSRLLQAGSVVVYTADESADQRTQVAQAQLMLGDQLSLRAPAPDQIWPKGFVRATTGPGPLHVVAFGRADSLRIERFGESGYDFKPGWLSRLTSDPTIAFWGSLLGAYITLLLSIHPFLEKGADPGPAVDRWQRFIQFFMKTAD